MPTAIVVDDALFMRKVIRKMLEEWGLEVVAEASNGQQAVDLYKEHRPNLMTLDVTMPLKTGLEALQEIIELDAKACIVMVTALGQQQRIVEAMELGATDFIVKPFSNDRFKEVIENALAQQESE